MPQRLARDHIRCTSYRDTPGRQYEVLLRSDPGITSEYDVEEGQGALFVRYGPDGGGDQAAEAQIVLNDGDDFSGTGDTTIMNYRDPPFRFAVSPDHRRVRVSFMPVVGSDSYERVDDSGISTVTATIGCASRRN